jgi:hypothetical protein
MLVILPRPSEFLISDRTFNYQTDAVRCAPAHFVRGAPQNRVGLGQNWRIYPQRVFDSLKRLADNRRDDFSVPITDRDRVARCFRVTTMLEC